MRRFMLIVAFLMLTAGCTQKAPDAYLVMFEDAPNLFENKVYHLGSEIGDILETQAGPTGAVRLSLAIHSGHQDRITETTVFYVAAGRLNLASLSGYGPPLAPGQAILGFGSKMALRWFKVKTALGQSSLAAAAKAQAMLAAFQ
jgi:hypothetical protein